MVRPLAALLCIAALTTLSAQQTPTPQVPENTLRSRFTPLPIPNVSKSQLELIQLESDFAADVAKGGGRAFASWFADDAVTLNNGQPAVLGQTAIAARTQWSPKNYQLTWYPEGAQMGPSNDTGFTWGHYDATAIAADGKSSVTSGRYITFWKKVNGKWKVALDASAEEPKSANILPGN